MYSLHIGMEGSHRWAICYRCLMRLVVKRRFINDTETFKKAMLLTDYMHRKKCIK